MKDKIIELLKNLVEIDSRYPNEKQLGDYLYNYFKNKDFVVYKQEAEDNRFNLVVEKGQGQKSLAFYGHLDTVDIVNGWTKEPHKLIIEDDKAFGLGSFDMKGGMVANILTFLNANPKNFKLKLIFCFDEENISTGSHNLKTQDYVKDIECLISPEPAFKYGINGITIGRIGRSVFEIELNNSSRHFMFYEPSQDLNLLSSKIISRLQNLYKEPQENKREFVYVRKIESQAKGMSVPEKVFIELESSILPPKTNTQVLNELQQIVDQEILNFSETITYDVRLKSRVTPFLNSYEVKADNIYLKNLMHSVEEVTNQPAQPYFRSSVADDNVFAELGITVLGIGPEGNGAHAPDEYVSLSSIEKLVEIFSRFVEEMDKP